MPDSAHHQPRPVAPKNKKSAARAPQRRARMVAFFALVGGLTFLLATAMAAFFVNKANNQASTLVTHTITVLSITRAYQSALQAAVIGERAFLLSGDDDYLADYEDALSKYTQARTTVRNLTRNNISQQARLDELDLHANSIISSLQRTIENAKSVTPTDKQYLIRHNNIDRTLAEFNDLTDQMINEERNLLRARRLAQFKTDKLVSQIILGSLGLTAGLLLLQVIITHEQNRTQQARNIELENRVALRTQELEAAKKSLEEENLRVESLLRDLYHRVGNSLQLVASFLGLQAKQVGGEEAKTTLYAARQRVFALAATQRRLSLSANHETTDAKKFITMIVEDLKTNLIFEQDIAFKTEISPAPIQSRDAVTIGVLISELVTNAVKYAFRSCDDGAIRVIFHADEQESECTLIVADDGVGMAASETDPHGGLGTQIIENLVRALGGEIARANQGPDPRPGTKITVTFPNPTLAEGAEA